MKEIFDLTDQVAIVTGGARGIGKAIALGLANFGANIVIADISLREAEQTAGEIEKLGRKAIVVKVDVTKKREIDKMVRKTIQHFRKIDILVNNAGILKTAEPENISEADWDKVMAINLKGYFLCAQAVGREMIKRKQGKIINIASIAGEIAFAQAAAYNSSKGGVILLTESLGCDWAKHNIRVNAIAPGVIETAMTKDFLANKKFLEMVKVKVPLSRAGKPEEIAGAAIFLASKASSYMTGNVINIDGGWTTIL